MRLLNVICTLDARYGGPVMGLRGLAESLVADGHSVVIATLDGPGEVPLSTIPQVEIVELGPSYGKFGASQYRYTPTLVSWLKDNYRGFDAAIVHGIWQYQSFGVWRALRKRLPYYVFVHGALNPWFKRQYPLKHLKKWAYWPWAEYRVLRDAAGVVFTSALEREEARQSFWLYKVKEMEWRFGIPPPTDDPQVSREAFQEAFPHLKGKRMLLLLSRLHAVKGCDLAISALARLNGHEPEMHLVIAGPDQGGLVDSLKQLATSLGVAERVHFPGMLKGNLKWGALRSAEAFLLPSHGENFGIAVVEAMACGTPVLISNKVNIWREIEAAGAGLVASDDVAGTALMLERWLALPQEKREQMRVAASREFHARFNMRANIRDLVEMIQNSGVERRERAPQRGP